MADKKNVQDELRQMTDPIVNREDYRIEWFDPSKLQNADINISQYGDDSSAKNYNNPSLWWWENQKYTGENTLGSQVAYNPNATIEWLDPTYKYGQAAQMQNSAEANYIAKRNDEIASALYNAWKTSIQDVSDFLSWQEGWQYSNANERANTINAVWKRIGQIWEQNKEETPEEKPEPNEDAIKWMEEDLNKSTSGKLYGKTTADEWDPLNGITTLEDENSIYKKMNEARLQTFKNLEAMSDESIASAIISNSMSWDWQWMRDLMQYDYAKYERVKLAEKKMRWQMAVDAITNGKEDNSSVVDTTNTNTDLVNSAVSGASYATSATQLLQWIESILSSNDVASSAQELMQSIENDMAKLKNRMKNLRSEANTVFKWDTPDYLVNAYIANKTQEIQNQMSILEDRYNAAYTRYQSEVQQAQWQAEYDLKKQSLALEEYKAKNWTSSTTNKKYSVAERNNNPTNMTVDFLKIMWAELWVDYEVSDDYFINSNWNKQYYWKLIWDPIERTISILDKWVANGKNPFTTTSWSYINELWLTKEKWMNMSHDEKVEMVKKRLPYEWGSMENMAYYLQQNWTDEKYDEQHAPYYQKFIDADYTSTKRPEEMAKNLGYESVADFRDAAYAWKDAQLKQIEEDSKNKPATWTRKDGTEFSLADTPTYDTLTYDQKNVVQQLLNLNKNPNTVTKRQYGDAFEQIISAVKEINPNWSEADYWQADKVEKEWNTSTKNGSNSRNGTAIATAMELYNIADEIGNTKWKDWNEMINKFKDKLSNETYVKLSTNLEVLATEFAWALKGTNAAPSIEEITNAKEVLSRNLGSWAMKTASKEVAKALYNKNVNEAQNYKFETLKKPNLIVTPEVADWMYNVAWITSLPDFYNYKPEGYVEEINDLELDEAIENATSVGDLITGN